MGNGLQIRGGKLGFSANQLKCIAVVAMIIDHIAWGFVDMYSVQGQIMHIIGRLTIPIMCYFVAEGFAHTSNLVRYIRRMAIFAAISYVPYVLYLKHGFFRMDFIFDLLLALLFLTIWEKTSWKKCFKIIGTIGLFAVSAIFSGWPVLPMLFVADFYYNRDNRQKQMKYFAVLVTGFTILSTLSLLTPAGWLGDTSIPAWGKLYFLGFLIAIPLLRNYNGQLGKSKDLKWLFYIIYPGHLMILYLVKELSVFQLYCAISIMVLVFLTFMIIKSLLEVPSKAQIYFVLSMCGVAAFVLGVLLELSMSSSLEGAMACLKLQYAGQVILLLTFLLFVSNFASIHLPKGIFVIQGVVGTIDLVACLTMEFHSLFYINPVISYSGEYPMIQKTSGIFFIVHYVDMAAVLLGILALCLHRYIKGNEIDKKRVSYILCGLGVVIAELILKAFGVFGTYNPISVALFILMLFLFASFFRYGYFDTVQVATANVLNQGNEGLLVADSSDRILSVNRLILEILPEVKVGEKLTKYKRLIPFIDGAETEIRMGNKIFEVRHERLENKQHYEQGYMLWFVDMTEHTKYMETLQNYKLELEKEVKSQADVMKKQDEKIMNMQKEVIISIANIIESRDGTTGEHVKRSSNYVALLISQMKKYHVYSEQLTDSFVNHICNAAPMHDIGKIAIPDSVLQKPGRLETEEISIMNTHTNEGSRIIKRTMNGIEDSDYVNIAVNVAKYHHEKWNGKGYPAGLKQEEIPLEARIMAVADVFDALTAERQYKKAMPFDKAYDVMENEMSAQFDPKIIEVFLKSKEEFGNMLNSY